MKSNNLFEDKFLELIGEENLAGGPGSVFGAGSIQPIGDAGNQFPSQNDNAYAPGDSRIPKVLGAKKGKKKNKIVYQRRPLPGLEL